MIVVVNICFDSWGKLYECLTSAMARILKNSCCFATTKINDQFPMAINQGFAKFMNDLLNS